MGRSIGMTVLGVFAAVAAARAADRPIAVAKLQLVRSKSGREKLVLLVKDPQMPFPAPGSADDPVAGTPGGIRLDVAAEHVAAPASLPAPAGSGWRTTTATYRYANRDAPAGPSPIKTITWKQARVFKVTAASGGVPLTAPLGRVAVRVVAGTTRACGIMTVAKRDQPGSYLAVNAPAPAIPDCSDASLGFPSGTTTTSTTTASTTSTTLPSTADILDLTTTASTATCGRSADASNTTLRAFKCGGLELGAGRGTVPESVIPPGSTSRFQLTGCSGGVCSLAGWPASGPTFDCTTTGCPFGTPLPIPNGGSTTCVVNHIGGDVGGHLDMVNGTTSDLAVSLNATVFLTGIPSQPCPVCTVSGSPSPSNPVSGTCSRGARAGQACTTTNPSGLSRDCTPGGSDNSQNVGTIPIALSPLATATLTDDAANGLFCPAQTHAGCFGAGTCTHIEISGSPAGSIDPDGPARDVGIAAIFCLPKTGSGVVDIAGDLPGPGAASLNASLARHTFVNTTTTTIAGGTSTTSTTVPTTTSTTTTSTTTSTSTTTTLLPLPPLTVEFASTAGSGSCGASRDAGNGVLRSLDCGSLALGAGSGSIPPSALPDGAVVRFNLNLGSCSLPPQPLGSCALSATTTPGTGFDCTNTGCFFGPPTPVPNGGLSACSVNTFAAPASGSVALLTGDTTTNVVLALHLFLTGDPDHPCPRCSATGSPAAPGTGTCDRGANAGGACTTTNSQGLSHDCLPGGTDGSVDVGTITATLSPVTTGSANLGSSDGLLCPGQANAGCFGNPACRSIGLTGHSPGIAVGAALTPQPATLVSAFCIPATGNLVVDGPAGLPGPAAISLAGTVRSSL